MELRDYVRMLRRGWSIIVVLGAVGVLLGVFYLRVTPATYQASSLLLATPRNAGNLSDLQQGAQYATSTAPTIASLMSSTAVLGPAVAAANRSSGGLAEPVDESELAGSLAVVAQEGTSIISIVVTSSDADRAASLADAVATSAVDTVPGLLGDDTRSSNAPLLTMQVVQQSSTPSAPVSPDERRILVVTAFIGLALGLALTITRQSLDSRLLEVRDLRVVTDTKLLAVLPRRRRTKKAPVVVRDTPSSASVEAYRILRTNLGQPSRPTSRSILFAPVASDEFAVRVPVNVAWSLAQAGRRTLLIDLDLRHHVVADLLGLENKVGATDLLSGGPADPSHVVRPSSQPRLDVITSGTSSQAPSDLLSGPALAKMVRAAEDSYDVVVLNLPPFLAYSDAAVVSRVVTETVVVVRAGQTRAPELTAALEVLSNVGVEPLGLVLTGARNSVVELPRLAPASARQLVGSTRGARARRRGSGTSSDPEAPLDKVLE